MSVVLFSLYRRRGLRDAFHLAGMGRWLRNAGLICTALALAFVAVRAVADMAIAEDEAYAAKVRAERAAVQAEATWLSCLNHKGVWVEGRLHTCTLADTHLTREHFKK